MTRVVVLYGGISAERAVSLSSGIEVIAALRESGFAVDPVDVGRDLGAVVAALTPKPDAVFNALHGRFGEDGAIQGLLEMAGVPYVLLPAGWFRSTNWRRGTRCRCPMW